MSDFELTGFDALNEKLEKIARIAPQKINAFVKQEAELLKGDAAQNTPTDTSNLKMGWKRGSLAGGVAVVYNNVDYAEAADIDDYGPSSTCERWDLWYLPDSNNGGQLVDGGRLWRGMAIWYLNQWRNERV